MAQAYGAPQKPGGGVNAKFALDQLADAIVVVPSRKPPMTGAPIGKPLAARPIGAVVAGNPFSVAMPAHTV
jgi:hypothetical protein